MASSKQTRRAPARKTAAPARAAEPGVIARVAEHAIDNPAMTGGLFVMALTMTAIVSNALLLQSSDHPGPMFATRTETADSRPAPVPLPRERVVPPIPRDAPTPARSIEAARAADRALIAGIQKELAAIKLYKGAVDGKFGAQSRAAIVAYQKREKLPVTGDPSAELLARLRDRGSAASPPPAAPAERVAAKPAPAAPVVEAKAPAAPAPVVEAKAPPAPAPAPAAEAKAPPADPIAQAVAEPVAEPEAPVAPAAPAAKAAPDPAALLVARYSRVQRALNAIGYGPIAIDGQPTAETEDAIRRFELDNGLPLNGIADDAVLARLAKIGALTTD
jgi:peptidoglycan hydrolase-like protein with peptidoglycan-binding domain